MKSPRSAQERSAAIAEFAYRLWVRRGYPRGSPDEDWYQAELIIDRDENSSRWKRRSFAKPAERTGRRSGARFVSRYLTVIFAVQVIAPRNSAKRVTFGARLYRRSAEIVGFETVSCKQR